MVARACPEATLRLDGWSRGEPPAQAVRCHHLLTSVLGDGEISVEKFLFDQKEDAIW